MEKTWEGKSRKFNGPVMDSWPVMIFGSAYE